MTLSYFFLNNKTFNWSFLYSIFYFVSSVEFSNNFSLIFTRGFFSEKERISSKLYLLNNYDVLNHIESTWELFNISFVNSWGFPFLINSSILSSFTSLFFLYFFFSGDLLLLPFSPRVVWVHHEVNFLFYIISHLLNIFYLKIHLLKIFSL